MIVLFKVDFLVLDMQLLTDQHADVMLIQAGCLWMEFVKVYAPKEVPFHRLDSEMNAFEQLHLILYQLDVNKTQTRLKETVFVTQLMTIMRTKLKTETKLIVSQDVKLIGLIKLPQTMIAGPLQLHQLELITQRVR